MSSDKIQSISRFAQVLAFSFIVPVFSYPLVVAGFLGPSGFGGNRFSDTVWITQVLFVSGFALLFFAGKLSWIPLRMVAKSKNRNERRLIGGYLASVLFGLIIREFVAILGLLLTLKEKNLFWCLGLGLAAFISIARNWPRRAEVEALLRQPTTPLQ